MKRLLLLTVCYALFCCGLANASEETHSAEVDLNDKQARFEQFLSGQGRDRGSLDEGCLPADSVTAQVVSGRIHVRFYARQTGDYRVYYTENPNLNTTPPGAGWTYEYSETINVPGPRTFTDFSPSPLYRKYVVTHTCLPPTNDENCLRSGIFNGTYYFSTIGATTDGPDEPIMCDFSGDSQIYNDIWYVYHPDCSGPATISLCGSNYDTKIAVYSSLDCPTASGALVCNDDYCGNRSSVTFDAINGTSYVVRVGSFSGDWGTGTMRIYQGQGNDSCANATNVGNGTIPFSTVCATTDGPVELFGQCGQDVWYRYVATGCGPTVFSLCGSGYDTRICVYNGTTCPTSPNTALAADDDFCSLQSQVTVTTVSGQTYLVRVGGYTTHFGTGTLTITPPAAPANDLVCNATSVGAGDFNFNTTLACTDGPGGGGVHCDATKDVWFVTQIPQCGRILVSTCNSTFDTEIQVYHTSDCHNLGPAIACNDDTTACGNSYRSLVEFATPDQGPYFIRIGGYAGASGTGQVHIQFTYELVGNDACTNAAIMTYFPILVSNHCAGTDGNPTSCGQIYNDVWFTLDAVEDETTWITVCDPPFPARIAVYHALFSGCGANLTLVTCGDNNCNDIGAAVQFYRPLNQPGTYIVRLGGASINDEGTFGVDVFLQR